VAGERNAALFVLEPRYRLRHGFSSRLRLDEEGLAGARRLVERLDAEWRARRPGFEAMALAIFGELAVFLCRQYSNVRTPPGLALMRVGEVVSLIERDFARPLTLEQLARTAHLSKNQLLRVFREATGRTPVQFLLRVRLDRAARLLRDSAMNVTQVASAVGFADPNYFSRRFREAMGVSPTAYRRRQRPTTNFTNETNCTESA